MLKVSAKFGATEFIWELDPNDRNWPPDADDRLRAACLLASALAKEMQFLNHHGYSVADAHRLASTTLQEIMSLSVTADIVYEANLHIADEAEAAAMLEEEDPE